MRKKLKLKKNIWQKAVIIFFLIIAIFAINVIYKNYKYKKTYEYKLITHGYNKQDTKLLLNNFKKDKELDFFLNKEVNHDYIKLLKEKYFLNKNYFKYLEYKEKNPRKSLNEIVRDVNIHKDKDFYEIKLKTDTKMDTLMLVNKYYLLSEDYKPEDLIYIPQTYAWGEKNSKQIRKVCFDAYLEMWNAAKEDGYYLMINSSYRTYEEQQKVYNNFKEKRGKNYADSIAARPGASEHETGLALDIFSTKNTNKRTFNTTEEAKWLEDNAYKYGFILRYPKGKEKITGYEYEAWHYRYIGNKAAKYCYENDITFDEYYAYFVEK